MKKTGKRNGFTLIELMIVVAIIGILASIAIPNFILMQARVKQSEAKMNLAGAWLCQKAYFGEYSTFVGGTTAFQAIGWAPMTTDVTRYAYIIEDSILMPNRFPPLSLPPGIASTQESFTIIAAGNIDTDIAIDIWTIDDAKIIDNTQSDLGN